jgi:flagellin
MTVINTNIKSLVSQTALERNSRDLGKAMHQLSTGKRINTAADDAAGLAISNRMTSQIRGLDQAVRNANDGISMLQTTEGALQEVTNMLQRMRELAVQSANATNTSVDRGFLQLENAELQAEITRIADSTQWNGMNITNTAAAANLSAATFQVGANANQVITMAFVDVAALTGVASSIASTLTIATVTGANAAISVLDSGIAAIDSYRATLGAKVNRLTYAADNLTNVSTNSSAARSRILDTDYAKAASELSRTQIIQQAATAVLAQANVDQQSVLKLLQG